MVKIPFHILFPGFILKILFLPLLYHRRRKYGYSYMRIKLKQNKFASVSVSPSFYVFVDFADYCRLIAYDWYALRGRHTFYAESPCYIDGVLRRVRMHRLIMAAKKGEVIDHLNRNGLDNRRANLRPASVAQNNLNTCRGFNSPTSKYKCVFYDKKAGRFRAVISVNGRRKHLGYFDNEEDAAHAYDAAAKLYHGEFAVLNFPDKSSVQIV